MSSNNKTVAAGYGQSQFFVWDLESTELLHIIDATKIITDSRHEKFAFSLSDDSTYVIITSDPVKAHTKSTQKMSSRCVLYNTTNGKCLLLVMESILLFCLYRSCLLILAVHENFIFLFNCVHNLYTSIIISL